MRMVRLGVNGEVYEVNSIRLYPEDKVAEWQAALRSAHAKLGGFSTGLGFWGSPGWVLGAAALLSALESKIADEKAKEGLAELQTAATILRDLRWSGVMIPINDIRNIEDPTPDRWTTPVELEQKVDLNKIAFLDRGPFLKKHGLAKTHVVQGAVTVKVPSSLIILGDDFVDVETDSGSHSIRWSAVSTYQFVT